MPTYQYVCTECDTPLEAVQSFTDDALTVCPTCGGRLRKVFSAVGVVFKGRASTAPTPAVRRSAAVADSTESGKSTAKEGSSSGSGERARSSDKSGSGDKAATPSKEQLELERFRWLDVARAQDRWLVLRSLTGSPDRAAPYARMSGPKSRLEQVQGDLASGIGCGRAARAAPRG